MQVWKLTRFELKKAVGSRFFAAAFLVLFTVNCLFWCGNFGGFGVSRKIAEYEEGAYAILDGMTPEEFADFQESMISKYGEDTFSPYLDAPEEMMQRPGYFGDVCSDWDLVRLHVHMKMNTDNNEEAFARVLNAAKGFGREALLAGDDYEVRQNLNIIRLYSVPRAGLTRLVGGWNTFLFGNHTMLLVFLLILQCSAGSFTKEKEQQTFLLLHTAKNGKGKTLAAKFLASAVCAAGFTLLFQGGSLLTIYLNYGLVGVGQTVAGIQELRLCPFALTVGQYVLLALACQVFAAVVLSVLLTAVSALSRSSVLSYGACMVLTGACVWRLFDPPRSEWFAGPLALARPERYFASYYTADFFSYPLLWAAAQVILWCVLGAVLILLAGLVYHRKRRRL